MAHFGHPRHPAFFDGWGKDQHPWRQITTLMADLKRLRWNLGTGGSTSWDGHVGANRVVWRFGSDRHPTWPRTRARTVSKFGPLETTGSSLVQILDLRYSGGKTDECYDSGNSASDDMVCEPCILWPVSNWRSPWSKPFGCCSKKGRTGLDL